MGRRSVNISVQWLDVPQPFGETVIATASWTENIYVNLWGTNPTIITNVPINRHAIPNVPINLRTVACRARDDVLSANRVVRRQNLQRELHTQIISEIRDKVLSDDYDDGWLKEGWSD